MEGAMTTKKKTGGESGSWPAWQNRLLRWKRSRAGVVMRESTSAAQGREVEACTSRRGAAGLDNTWDPPRISPPAGSTRPRVLDVDRRERERRDGGWCRTRWKWEWNRGADAADPSTRHASPSTSSHSRRGGWFLPVLATTFISES